MPPITSLFSSASINGRTIPILYIGSLEKYALGVGCQNIAMPVLLVELLKDQASNEFLPSFHQDHDLARLAEPSAAKVQILPF